jgi:plastocyanin
MATVAAAIVIAASAVVPKVAGSSATVREVELTVRGMSFRLDGDDAANPTLRFAPGETVRIVLVNDDPGYRHNLVIPSLDVHTGLIDAGERATVEVVVPQKTGTRVYSCEPHAAMMRGNIAIE